ncbi:MAG: PQQ-dependent sugar dehydrogenase [Candidatus Saccharimonadales bacterium]
MAFIKNRSRGFGLLGVVIVLGVITAVSLAFWYVQKETAKEKQLKITTEVVAKKLAVPWEIAFLPAGDMLITERRGTLKRIGTGTQIYNVSGVEHIGEGGLLGLALHPNFEDNRLLYLYLTTRSGDDLINRAERYRLTDDQLTEKTVIISDIPGAANHDGGRLAFGPDGMLYITTGDAGQPQLAQDKNSLAGKILRLTDNGRVPASNPLGSAVYSLGHRNPQGLAWDNKGQLWATEHGQSAYDEVNLIKPGGNYGWPIIQGDETQAGMTGPIAHSGPNETWAPSGMAFADGSLFFSGLRGKTLYKAKLNPDNSLAISSHYSGEFGRLRAVVVGPNDNLYISTSNTDGRGDIISDDDRIIRLRLELFR